MRCIFSFLLCLFVGLTVQAQSVWKWPADTAKAKEQYVLYSDLSKTDPAAAVAPLEWLLTEAPDLNVALYIGGTKVYEDLAEAEADVDRKTVYQEKAIAMYDARMRYFGNEADVLNRKAFSAYKYYRGNKEKYPELVALFDRVMALNGAATLESNLRAFIDILRRYHLAGGGPGNEKTFEYYNQIVDVIDAKAAKEGETDKIIRLREDIQTVLISFLPIDCGFIENNLAAKMRQDTSNISTAKKVLQLLLTGKCYDSPLYLETALLVHKKEPAYGFARMIAAKYTTSGDLNEAITYHQQAVELTDDSGKKAEIYLELARIHATRGEKVTARSNARKALAADPALAEAYNLIGNLYYGSFDECKAGLSKVKDRGVYIAAHDMYRRGGNSQGMANAQSQFPSIEEIFTEGMKEGQPIEVGCWIQETVVLQRR